MPHNLGTLHQVYTPCLPWVWNFLQGFVSSTWWQFCQCHLVEIFCQYSSILTTEPLGVGAFPRMMYNGVGHFLQYSKNLNVNSPPFVVETNDWCINIQDFNNRKYICVFSLFDQHAHIYNHMQQYLHNYTFFGKYT